MKYLKELKIVLILIAVVLVLVIAQTTGKNRFKQDANNAVEAAARNNFSVSVSELKSAENDYLIVDLNDSGKAHFENSLQIPLEKLLDETNLKKLKETENKILLVSDDNSKAEKGWVILNQLGFENVFVLSTVENEEVLKYEFQPDTTKALESVSE